MTALRGDLVFSYWIYIYGKEQTQFMDLLNQTIKLLK
jgi:hypothetical protein